MRKIVFSVVPCLALSVIVSTVWACNISELSVHRYEGNGHYYMAVPGKFTWAEAQEQVWEVAQIMAMPGFSANLASLTSAGENDFVWTSLGTEVSHFWLGGKQTSETSEPAGAWSWVDNDVWDYSNWFTPAEPNDAGSKQHHLSFWGGPQGQWMDVRDNWGGIKGFVVEFSPAAVPLPAPVLLLASGILGLVAIRRGCSK